MIFETATPDGVPCADAACPFKFQHRHAEGHFVPASDDDDLEFDDHLGRALREQETE